MNADVKRRWVEALRSGEYEQGVTLLCNSDRKMCCLGVLADTQGKLVEISGQWGVRDTDGTINRHTLPHSLNEEYGLNALQERDEDGEEFELWAFLTGFNDQSGWTFAQIADWIDANIPED